MRDVGGHISVFGLVTRHGLEGSKTDGARFSAPVQTVPDAYPASCAMGTGFLYRV